MKRKFDCLIVFLVSFLVYLKTLAPTIWWGDTGDFITSAFVLGVPHPTGYPTYTLLGKLFTFLPFGDVAFRVNMMSAFFAALTVVFVYLCTYLLTKRKVAGYIAAFTLAFSAIFWSQALIAEVYVLNAFFLTICFYFLLRWKDDRKSKFLYLFGLFFGLGLGNHRLLALFIPAFLFFIGVYYKDLKWKYLLIGFLIFLVGLGVYVYLPLASLQDPVQDWGNPENVDNFLWVVKGEQYTERYFKLGGFWERFGRSLNFLASQFVLLGFSLIGIYYFLKKDLRFLIFGLIVVGFNFLFAGFYDIPDLMSYYIPAFVIFSILIGAGLGYLIYMLKGSSRKVMSVIIVLIVIGLSIFVYYDDVDLSNDYSAREFGENALNFVEQDSVLFTQSDTVFIFWYLQKVEKVREDVVVINQVMLPMKWYREQLEMIHPDVVIDEDIDVILEKNKAARNVYYADIGFAEMSYKELSKQLPSKL